ncbi:Mob1/phocein [Piptocephalis cylindrospora]|uniref:Mob1/phocein n=1 Tax=Piptocephalis cylindrospora TaxID=1907219 RepID=A0A4P9Y7D1_9FUNG|nr:Mob1/phocein [Piptocephalis cylindrospora]|eukprot:RKP14634.1 Mob1/phocein [Piptocephalis cylindrospora]
MTTTAASTTNTPDTQETLLQERPLRRNRVGTQGQDLYSWPEQSFSELDSPFALQEYLQELVRTDPSGVERHIQLPEDQDPEVWQYEHLRAVCQELHCLVVQLVPECTVHTCPEMKAGDWIYLCAAHSHPQPCCAIDYTLHTLDGATSLLNSNKYFPSRLSIQPSSLKHFQSISRRLYRLFAHAWYAHREVFDSFESETYLYDRFMKLSKKYGLISESVSLAPAITPSDSPSSS